MSDKATGWDAHAYLQSCACLSDQEIDLGLLSLAVIAPEHEGKSIDRYHTHLAKNAKASAARYDVLIANGSADDAGTRLAALKHVLSDQKGGYFPASHDDEVLETADMMRVIDRGVGLGDALAVLYLDAARKNGWAMEALAFPDRLLCRLQHGAEHLIFDPSSPDKILLAHDLRSLVKNALGEEAELSNAYYEALSAAQIVIRLNNRIKLRYTEMGDYARALGVVKRLRVLAPDEYRLLLDEGVLAMRTNDLERAKTALQSYIETAPDYYDRQEAILLLREIT